MDFGEIAFCVLPGEVRISLDRTLRASRMVARGCLIQFVAKLFYEFCQSGGIHFTSCAFGEVTPVPVRLLSGGCFLLLHYPPLLLHARRSLQLASHFK